MEKSQRWVVTGVVQGVGFRPWIWQVAHQLGIKGTVCNTAVGAQIDLYQPTSAQCDAFRLALSSTPPLCRIDSVTVHPIILPEAVGFEIQTSQMGDPHAGVPADAATCQACLDEMNDPTNRRYQYPFINCTHCGPRLSIIQSIPYDRASTTMAAFEQCDACLAEYTNPADRRFHAQPNACPVCGPTVWICDQEGEPVSTQDWVSLMVDALEQGQIVAIKGVGGFHLCCDATQAEAIKRLRALKHRPDKPLAVMFASRSALSETPSVKALSHDAQSLLWATLQSPIAPVVLVPWKPTSQHDGQNANDIAFNELAPRQHRLGVILPYSPIHHLVMQAFQRPLVMTSGNRSGFPQAITNDAALTQLRGIADFFVLNNRDIHNRVDDSVLALNVGLTESCTPSTEVLRRARGLSPWMSPLPNGFDTQHECVALGAELKAAQCWIKAGQWIVSQYLGDMDNPANQDAYQQTAALYQGLYRHSNQHWVVDQHPGYRTVQWAEQAKQSGGIRTVTQVQHHHAHLASLLADHHLPKDTEVLALCFDGTGLGVDNTLWGGEWLLGGYRSVKRVASLAPFALIGGTAAIQSPWRSWLGQWLAAGLSGAPNSAFASLSDKPVEPLKAMAQKGLNSPITSSIGRLFDAAAAALGVAPDKVTYEGQAAIELEALAMQSTWVKRPFDQQLAFCQKVSQAWPIDILEDRLTLNPAPWWQDIQEAHGLTAPDWAWLFHLRLAISAVELTTRVLKLEEGLPLTIALTGGVMQNASLRELITLTLTSAHPEAVVLTHQQLPANDGGLCVGQALVALANHEVDGN